MSLISRQFKSDLANCFDKYIGDVRPKDLKKYLVARACRVFFQHLYTEEGPYMYVIWSLIFCDLSGGDDAYWRARYEGANELKETLSPLLNRYPKIKALMYSEQRVPKTNNKGGCVTRRRNPALPKIKKKK